MKILEKNVRQLEAKSDLSESTFKKNEKLNKHHIHNVLQSLCLFLRLEETQDFEVFFAKRNYFVSPQKNSLAQDINGYYLSGKLKWQDYKDLMVKLAKASHQNENNIEQAIQSNNKLDVQRIKKIISQSGWASKGIAGFFKRKMPEGIEGMLKATTFSEMLACIKPKSFFRSPITQAFYDLVIALNSLPSRSVRDAMFEAFESKWGSQLNLPANLNPNPSKKCRV